MHTSVPSDTPLARPEQAQLLKAIEASLALRTPAQFLRWSEEELQDLFPHQIFVCGVGKIQRNSVHILHYLNKGLPPGYLEVIRRPDGGVASPVMGQWRKECKPQLFESNSPWPGMAPAWLEAFRRFDLRNIAAHGLRDINSPVASYFNFSRIPGLLTPRHATLLELLVPHLHVALLRVFANGSGQRPHASSGEQLSQRGREILAWLREGKSNWEIAQILGRSENTVKHQVQAVLTQLNVNNRTQAVARAIDLKII